jgi:hypothetical protein
MVKEVVRELPNPDALREACHESCLEKDFEVVNFKQEKITVTRPECDKVFTHADGSKVCIGYLYPNAQWKLGCGLASNKIDLDEAAKKKKFVNPLKASKRGRR